MKPSRGPSEVSKVWPRKASDWEVKLLPGARERRVNLKLAMPQVPRPGPRAVRATEASELKPFAA